jgi:hypothetical protein
MKVYPNPAGSILNLNVDGIKGEDILDISILNMEGKLVMQKLIDKMQEIDISKLPAGIYMAQVKIDEKVFYSKFSKLE